MRPATFILCLINAGLLLRSWMGRGGSDLAGNAIQEGLLVLWALNLASEARERFAQGVCLGCAAFLFWHVTFNIGMVIGVLPVVGVTLPLVSYGGSSLITVMIALGLLMNVSIRRYSY